MTATATRKTGPAVAVAAPAAAHTWQPVAGNLGFTSACGLEVTGCHKLVRLAFSASVSPGDSAARADTEARLRKAVAAAVALRPEHKIYQEKEARHAELAAAGAGLEGELTAVAREIDDPALTRLPPLEMAAKLAALDEKRRRLRKQQADLGALVSRALAERQRAAQALSAIALEVAHTLVALERDAAVAGRPAAFDALCQAVAPLLDRVVQAEVVVRMVGGLDPAVLCREAVRLPE